MFRQNLKIFTSNGTYPQVASQGIAKKVSKYILVDGGKNVEGRAIINFLILKK
jgi:hypothetical protein